MGTLLEAVFVLAILASFGLVYMSSKTWRIYQVILAEFVFLAAVTFSYLAVRTLKTQQAWREADAAWHIAVDKIEQQNRDLLAGKHEQNRVVEDGIEQLNAELQRLANERGSAWFNAAPEKINPDSGVCQLAIEAPDPHEIAPKTVLFVFEEQPAENGGRYLGEFKVTKAQAKSTSIEIEPNLPLTDTQQARLKATKGTWALYAMMPVDNAELFAGMDEAERQKLLPKAARKEFASQQRTLRDYEYFFHQNTLECDLLADEMAKTEIDLQRTVAAEKKAQEEIKYRKSEKADLAADLEKFRFERQAITKYAQTLQQRAKALRDELNAALAMTARDAAQLKQLQLKAAAEINRLTADQASNNRQPAGPTP